MWYFYRISFSLCCTIASGQKYITEKLSRGSRICLKSCPYFQECNNDLVCLFYHLLLVNNCFDNRRCFHLVIEVFHTKLRKFSSPILQLMRKFQNGITLGLVKIFKRVYHCWDPEIIYRTSPIWTYTSAI